MKWMKRLVYLMCLLAFLGLALGCESEGPAEKAGKKIDQTMEEAGDQIEEMGDKLEEKTDQ